MAGLRDVFRALVIHGLRMEMKDLSRHERNDQLKVLRRILEHNEPGPVIQAIKHGMPNVWPFSEDARSFDAHDLEKNLLKAKSEVGNLRRRGQLPTYIKRDS